MIDEDAESEVREVYERLVAAFGEGRLHDYFACFTADATFVFHGEPWLGSLDEYRTAWNQWVQQDGFAVLGVETDVTSVQMLGDASVLTHSLETRQRTNVGEETVSERETIVFGKQSDGRWLVVHQHLSPNFVGTRDT